MKRLLAILGLGALALVAIAAQPEPTPMPRGCDEPKKADGEKKYPRGRKNPTAEVLAKRHADAFKRHDHRMKSLPTATPATFDCRAMGWVGPVRDQANCGTCWDVAGADNITSSFIKAGQAKNDGSFVISEQYLLDQCGYANAGCDGDDAVNVLDWAKSHGIPSEKDYGPYTATQGRCKFKSGTTLYKLADWVYCTPAQSQGVASVQDIKNALVQFGPVSSAVAADSSWDSPAADGSLPYRKLTPNDIDHNIQIVGWDDTKQIQGAPAKGVFIIKNQWGKNWGNGGYCLIAYGSHQIGTEAAVGVVAALPPPPTPGPTPTPVPPAPTPPTGGYTGKIVKVQEYVNGEPVGTEKLYLGLPSSAVEDYFKEAGLNPAVIADFLKLIVDFRKQPRDWNVIIADALQIAIDLGLMKKAEEADKPAPAPAPMPTEKDSRLYVPEYATAA